MVVSVEIVAVLAVNWVPLNVPKYAVENDSVDPLRVDIVAEDVNSEVTVPDVADS